MGLDNAIEVRKVYKKYKLYHSSQEKLLDLVSPKKHGKDFYALSDVNFTAEKGDIVGFVGINGSGKSTLSNIISGIVPETSGEVVTDGQTSLIAVNAGLKGDLTGRDNIELKCLMLGFSQKRIHELEPSIIDFSELGEFIDQPVKSYSSGMKSRLGFSISVNVDPDIMIIDEALSVGDKAFSEKSLQKMNEFKEMGKTMIFVSHSIGQMKQFCQKILWLEFGRVKAYGDTEEILPQYEAFLDSWQKMSKDERDKYKQLALDGRDYEMTELLEESKPNIQPYREVPVSYLAHLKKDATYIYDSPKDKTKKVSAVKYMRSVYFVKKKAVYNNEEYYLLSDLPSGQNGIIGWVKAEESSIHLHVLIDMDHKTLQLNGSGIGYTRPWGGKKNIAVASLENYEGQLFNVTYTEKIGKNFWYYGMTNKQGLWVHSKHTSEV